MVMLVGVVVAVAMLLVMMAEVVSGNRRGRESEGRDKKGGGEQGSQHWFFPKFRFVLSRKGGRQRKLTSSRPKAADHIPLW
jgi:hypothetical protein